MAITRGLREEGRAIVERLRAVERKVANRALRTATRAAGRRVLTRAKELVPKRSRRLERSLKLRAQRRSRQTFGVQVQTGYREELGIPSARPGYYPASQEWGWKGRRTRKQYPGHPYLRPALEKEADAALDVFEREVARVISGSA